MFISEPSSQSRREHEPPHAEPVPSISDDDAHCFLLIARYGTFVQASRRLNTKAPTLRKKMSQLEARLGRVLFVQKGHVLVLTRAGQDVHAKLSAQAPRTPLAAPTPGSPPLVRLAVAEPLLQDLLSRDLVDYLRVNATARVHITSFNEGTPLSTLAADVLVWSGAQRDQASVPGFADALSLPLASLHYWPHIAKRHSREPVRPRHLSDLDDFMLVQLLGDQQIQSLKPWNDLVHQRQSALTQVASHALRCTLIKSGVCVGLLPAYMPWIDVGLAALPELFSQPMIRDVWLSVRPDAAENNSAQTIAELIQNVFHERREWF
jgi:DNA-binding transcriptional LysR family regulator